MENVVHDLGKKLRQSYVIGRVFSPLASAEGHLRNSDRYVTTVVAPGLCGGFTARVPVVDLVFGDSGLARNQLRARHLFMGKPTCSRERGSTAHHCARKHHHDKADTVTRTSSTLHDGNEEFC